MNPLDILILVIMLYCLIRGIFRGLIKEIAAIIGVFGGFFFAYSYYGEVSVLLKRWITDTAYLNILSFIIIFAIVFILVSILGVIIKYLLNIAYLGWVDRICGAGFGGLKGILIVSVLLVAFTAFLPRGAPIIKDSLLAPLVTRISEKLAKVVPPEMKGQFIEKAEDLKNSWKI